MHIRQKNRLIKNLSSGVFCIEDVQIIMAVEIVKKHKNLYIK